MSAIYGAIDFSKKYVPSFIAGDYEEQYKKYRIDKQQSVTDNNCTMGCSVQYFTHEASAELLPIYEEEKGLFFTADCYLTNRAQLVQELQAPGFPYASAFCPNDVISGSEPDGTLMYLAYLRFGRDCVTHFRGSFSFVVYDSNANTALLFADHFSNRCVFYHIRDNVLYFSTLLFPLVASSHLKFEQNERWLVTSLSLRSPVMMLESTECAFQDIYKIECGTYIEVTEGKSSVHIYYDPLKQVPVNKKMTPDQVREGIHETFGNGVRSSLRSCGKIAIKLSSGLDSTSVAGFAAPALDAEGKELLSYTSIPSKESNTQNSKYGLSNETDGVLLFCERYPNIVPSFMDCAGTDFITELPDIIDMWELPCKSQQNAVWTGMIADRAYKDGCRILLSGATGNCTISAGSFETYWMDLLKHLHFIRADRALKKYCRHYKISRKQVIRIAARDISSYHYKHLLHKKADCYSNVLTLPTVGEKHGLTNRFTREVYFLHPIRSWKRLHKNIYLKHAYAQIGEVDTTESLKHGIMPQDPTRNVEFINFCFSLPIQYFADENFDRRLVREFLDDIVPDEIRTNTIMRGVQSADNNYRICNVWKKYADTIKETYHTEEAMHYIDIDKADRCWQEITDAVSPDKIDEDTIRLMTDCYSFCLYLQKMKPFC